PLLTCIANHATVMQQLTERLHIVQHVNSSHHCPYTMADRETRREHAQDDISIITTQKDIVKLDALALSAPFRLPLFYLPIEMVFLKDGSEFDDIVRSAVRVNDSGSDVL